MGSVATVIAIAAPDSLVRPASAAPRIACAVPYSASCATQS
jgi:hypothetical protein